MRKKWQLLAAGLCMVFALTGCGSEEKASSDSNTDPKYANLSSVDLILADSAGKGAAGELFDRSFAEHLEKITGGKIKVDFHPNGDLGNDVDLIRQLKNGDIDMVGSQIAPWASFIPQTAVFDYPMLFANYSGDAINEVLNGDTKTHAELEKAFNAAGLELITLEQNATFRMTTSNKPLNTLEDFKGLKIRTMENKNHMDFWSAIGASPTPLAFGELYISLQNGTVDAEENASDTIEGVNFQEVQKYLEDTKHILYVNQIVMNKKKYDALAPAYKEAIKQASQEALKEMRPQMVKTDQDAIGRLEKKGMKFIQYNKAFYEQVLALPSVKALYQKIDAQVGDLGKTLQQDLEAAAQKFPGGKS